MWFSIAFSLRPRRRAISRLRQPEEIMSSTRCSVGVSPDSTGGVGRSI
jgi:hypothetical protein